jgi:hypothetical protein
MRLQPTNRSPIENPVLIKIVVLLSGNRPYLNLLLTSSRRPMLASRDDDSRKKTREELIKLYSMKQIELKNRLRQYRLFT